MRRAISAVWLAAAFLLSGCGGIEQSGVQPGEGPAVTDEPMHGPIEGEPTEEPTEEPSPLQDDASFAEKYVYSDGLEVEVIKIRNGQFTAAQVEYVGNVKKGEPYTVFTIRVKNGSPKTVELNGSMRATYGPDGEEAEQSYLEGETGDLSGKLIKGKSRSAGFVFLIPTRFYDDVVLEVSPDFEHDSAVFSGSIK
jgi:Domain of unknown function (DUF4352)